MISITKSVGYDYSEILPYLNDKKWCTSRYIEQQLGRKRAWVIERLWTAYNDNIVECKEVINKRDRVTYAWRLIS